jgi:predicted ArsR family transcriptional regulator
MDDDHLEAIALLQDPARRALYEYVVEQGREVSRNEAAEAVGLQRTLAAFHLDRLAGAGLLEVTFRRLGARSGPGAGRPAKLYRRAAVEHAVSLPPRAYLRAATVLAAAIEGSGAEAALAETARAQGRAAGRALAEQAGAAGGGVGLAQVLHHLAEQGYAPATEPGPGAPGDEAARGEPAPGEAALVRLRNCPFHALAQAFPVVACGMNVALLEGLVDGARLDGRYTVRVDPQPGTCCAILCSKTNDS